jgi:hypothetical protein
MSGRRSLRDWARLPGDPALTFRECADDLGVDLATWRRRVLPEVDVIDISPRRRGVRRSVHERFKTLNERRAG